MNNTRKELVLIAICFTALAVQVITDDYRTVSVILYIYVVVNNLLSINLILNNKR